MTGRKTEASRNNNGGVIAKIAPPLSLLFPSVFGLPSRYLFAASNSARNRSINAPRLSYSRFSFRGFFLPSA